jgi:class I fructose-bisphosphate aldolase
MSADIPEQFPEHVPVDIAEMLGDEADDLLGHVCTAIRREQLSPPGPDFLDRVVAHSDRNNRVLASLNRLFQHGRLGGTGYLSILPVDQGIEHYSGTTFAPNPIYFDPEKIVELAMRGECNAFASTLGVLGSVARKYAHRLPFIVKLNHNELLTFPKKYDQHMFAHVDQAYNLGAVAVGATVYFGSEQSNRQIEEVSAAFARAHELGLATVLWCYLRHSAFKLDKERDYHVAADLTGQANYLGATIEADIIKQKQPQRNRGFEAVGFEGGFDKFYEVFGSDHPIDMTRYQVANCYMGRVGLINSGGASDPDPAKNLPLAVRTAVINKRAGGMGLISGRKAFQCEMHDGVELLKSIQDVYLDKSIEPA